MIRNQKIKGTFMCRPSVFKWMGVFQSWLDCFSIGYTDIHFLQFLNALNCSPITLFFKVHQTALHIVPILYNKACTSTGDSYLWKRLFKFE